MMSDFSFVSLSYDGLDEAKKGIEKTVKAIPGRIYDAVVQACSLIEIRAKTHHLAGETLKPGTHRLQQSVKSMVTRSITGVSGRVGSPVVYAAIHEYGGIIRPKNAKFLMFQINGTWIRTKQVTMPKREWLSKSLKDVQGKIEAIFGKQIKIAIG